MVRLWENRILRLFRKTITGAGQMKSAVIILAVPKESIRKPRKPEEGEILPVWLEEPLICFHWMFPGQKRIVNTLTGPERFTLYFITDEYGAGEFTAVLTEELSAPGGKGAWFGQEITVEFTLGPEGTFVVRKNGGGQETLNEGEIHLPDQGEKKSNGIFLNGKKWLSEQAADFLQKVTI